MVCWRSCLAVSTPCWVRGAGLDMAMEEVIEEGVFEEAVVREGAAWAGLAPLKVVLGRRVGRAVRTPSF